jgi:two-component system sensor histidine kinase BaeS
MRTKLFFAFLLVIFLAFISNVVFEKLIIRDFNEFLKGQEEDHIYWIMASVEGSYRNIEWNRPQLTDVLHWGLMLGFEAYIENLSGETVLSSKDVLSSMSPTMRERMQSLLILPDGPGEFNWYPLYIGGEEVGKLYIRPLERLGLVPLKEEIFRKRGKEFLMMSFLIAGGGALFLALLFTIYISNPIRKLTAAAETIAKGDFSIGGQGKKRTESISYKDEIDRLTQSFYYMAEALEREDSLRKHLTSNVAHELRTPLTIIKGNLEGIEDGVVADSGQAIRNVSSEIQRLISLVEGIEDITRAEASFFKRGPAEKIELGHFIEALSSGMEKLFREKGLFFRTDGPSLAVMTYPDKLHIILKNLVTNALKYTDTGGVTIRWDRVRRDVADSFFIAVEDTGRGIPEEEQPKVFKRFFKNRDSGGRGLGLAIVKELTMVMGGTVEFESAVGKGSRFILKFSKPGT